MGAVQIDESGNMSELDGPARRGCALYLDCLRAVLHALWRLPLGVCAELDVFASTWTIVALMRCPQPTIDCMKAAIAHLCNEKREQDAVSSKY